MRKRLRKKPSLPKPIFSHRRIRSFSNKRACSIKGISERVGYGKGQLYADYCWKRRWNKEKTLSSRSTTNGGRSLSGRNSRFIWLAVGDVESGWPDCLHQSWIARREYYQQILHTHQCSTTTKVPLWTISFSKGETSKSNIENPSSINRGATNSIHSGLE